ncbi:uncharacterized protein LOC113799716 [Dermatophagoides pteronyssinus]|uniref:uncharacterized protein LOC113799716 n=1 Tax=Dermatophagoides pteronyssinus TaxID=6956 RepID=UPI003F67F927
MQTFCLSFYIFLIKIAFIQTATKNCFELRQEIIDHIIAVGPYYHDNYLLFITDKWLAYNTTINSLINDVEVDLLSNNGEIHNLWPVMNQFIHFNRMERLPVSIYLAGDTCYNSNNQSELIVTFKSKKDKLYHTYHFDFEIDRLILNDNLTEKDKTYQKIIVDDCQNRTLIIENYEFYLLDNNLNENYRFNICVQQSNIDQHRMEIGTTIHECNDNYQSRLIFSNVRTGFLVSKTGQLYLISKDYLLIFSHNAIIDHEKYFVLTTKSFYQWLDCGDFAYLKQSGQSMNEADQFVSIISGFFFLFFIIYSLLVFHFMFRTNKSSANGKNLHNS